MSLCLLSNKQIASCVLDISLSFFSYPNLFWERKPTKIKLFMGILDTDSAHVSDDTPGTGITFIDSSTWDRR